jgi:ABC-2 type transport system permease protein
MEAAALYANSPIRTQARYLAWRSVIRTARQPIMIVPTLVFPLFLLAINASGLSAATEIPGFPTDSYLTFALAFPFIQGSIFATNTAGTNLAEDIQNGFFNRLQLTPMRGSSLLAGQLAGVLMVAIVQAITYLLVGLAAGAHFEAGIWGVPVLFALSFAISAGFGAFGLFVGLRSGSGEAVQGLFPLMFVLLFLSSASLPRDLIQQDWFQTAATINPVSYVIEAVRSLFVTGWDGEALALGFIVAISFFIVSMIAASFAMRGRLERT